MTFYTTIARYYDAEHQDKTDDLDMYSELAADYDGLCRRRQVPYPAG